MTLEAVLEELLEELTRIGKDHVELYDSDVREQMGVAIMDGFVRHEDGFTLSTDLGMASEKANHDVYVAIKRYICEANALAESLGMTKFHDRLAAFQNTEVTTKTLRRDYETFFGHTEPEFYDENGVVVRLQ